MKKRITVTIDSDVLDKEFECRKKGVSRSQHIQDLIVESLRRRKRKEGKEKTAVK